MKNETQQNTFCTSDFWIASTLMALDENLIHLDRSNSRRVTFIFKPSESLEMNVAEYKTGQIRLEPQKLLIQIRLLKSRLYDG